MERILVELTEEEARELRRIAKDTIIETPPSKGRRLLVSATKHIEEVLHG